MRAKLLICTTIASSIILAACGSGGDSSDEPSTSTPQASPSASATRSGVETPVSAPGTVSPTPASATPSVTPEASPTSAATTAPSATPQATATNPPQANTPVPTQAAPPTPTQPPASSNPMSATMGVTGTVRYFWAPSTVKIAPGGSVTFAWDSNAVHDLSIPSLGIATAPKKAASQTVVFSNPGTYQVICVVHEDTMKGTVIVQ